MGGGTSVQLVLVGVENSGKTTLLYHMKFGQYMHTQPTVGFNCEKVEVRSGKAKGMMLSVWDVGGKDNLRPLWRSYLRYICTPSYSPPLSLSGCPNRYICTPPQPRLFSLHL